MVVGELKRVSVLEVAAATTTVRSPGVHLSDLIALVMATIDASIYGPDAREFDPLDRANWQQMGFLFEELLTKLFAARTFARPDCQVIRAAEISVREGQTDIYLTPDWLGLDAHGVFLGESKLTWKSMSLWVPPVDVALRAKWRPDTALWDKKFIAWLFQIRGYLYALNLDRVLLSILFVNGTYDRRFVPELVEIPIQFTARELSDNWRQLVGMGRKAGLIV